MLGLRAVGASNLMALRNHTSRDLPQCPETGPGTAAAQENGSFRILHGPPGGAINSAWRSCLANSDLPAHYTSPEYFLEPGLRDRRPFAILSIDGNEVSGVLTGVNGGALVKSGVSVRPQIALSRRADPARAMTNLTAGLLAEARAAKLVDLFVWSDIDALVNSRFRQRRQEGVVMLDLSHAPDYLFRKFSQTTRNEIRRAIKYGVSVDIATTREDISSYYTVYRDWSRRKLIPFVEEDEFQEMFSLTQNRRLFVARHEGQVIAGAVLRFLHGGVAEYAANSSLERALQLHPNHLLQWRAIEWACAEGMAKYSLGGAHFFLRKFGGQIVPTTRCRLDLSLFRRVAFADWIADQAERVRPFIPDRLTTVARSLRGFLEVPRNLSGQVGGSSPTYTKPRRAGK